MLAFLLPSRSPTWLDILGLLGSLVVLAVSGDQFVIALVRIARTRCMSVRRWPPRSSVGSGRVSLSSLSPASRLAKSPSLALGSLVGSIVANVCLALAIAGLITTIRVDSAIVRQEAPLSVASVGLFALLAAAGVTFAKGIVMLAALVLVVAALLFLAKGKGNENELGAELTEFADLANRRSPIEVLRAVAMVACMLAGAELMVASSVGFAKHLGISQGFAGLTLVGIGTSAPLIAASIQAARRGEHDLVVGNVLGGNAFIALAGGGIVGVVAHGTAVHIEGPALVFMVGVVLFSWIAMARGTALVRAEAIILLLAYGATLPFISR